MTKPARQLPGEHTVLVQTPSWCWAVKSQVMKQAPPGWSAITKTLCTEFEVEVANWCGSVVGAEAMGAP